MTWQKVAEVERMVVGGGKLPELTGTEKQIAWAKDLRDEFNRKISNVTEDNYESVYNDVMSKLSYSSISENGALYQGKMLEESYDIGIKANEKAKLKYPDIPKEERKKIPLEERKKRTEEKKKVAKKEKYEMTKKVIKKYAKVVNEKMTRADHWINTRK